MPAIASLDTGATEVIRTLGHEGALVATTHECGYPNLAVTTPLLGEPEEHWKTKEALSGNQRQGNQRSRLLVEWSLSAHRIGAGELARTKAEVILTKVQKAPFMERGQVELAVKDVFGYLPTIVDIGEPTKISGVFDAITNLAGALNNEEAADRLVHRWKERMDAIRRDAPDSGGPPLPVACFSFASPFKAAPGWVADLIGHAGGVDALGAASDEEVSRGFLEDAAPELVVVASPWGSPELARQQMRRVVPGGKCDDGRVPAFERGNVCIVDASKALSSSVLDVVSSLEALIEMVNGTSVYGHYGSLWWYLSDSDEGKPGALTL